MGDQVLKHIWGGAAAIAEAPVAFFTALAAACALAFMIARWMYSTIIAHKNAEIASLQTMVKLRDDQLSNKFQTTPPDEALQLIEALQAQLARLAPRRIPKEKQFPLLGSVRPPTGENWTVDISWEATGSDTERLAYDFITLFGSTGWTVRPNREFGGNMAQV